MRVIDASVVVDLLLGEPAVIDRFEALAREGELSAPCLLDAEVGQVLRRYNLRGELDDTTAQEALADLAALPIERYPHEPLLQQAFSLRRNTTFYDALYLALAEALGVELVTRDRAMAAVPGIPVAVTVL